eukprot:563439-Rhodomonas_salina.1
MCCAPRSRLTSWRLRIRLARTETRARIELARPDKGWRGLRSGRIRLARCTTTSTWSGTTRLRRLRTRLYGPPSRPLLPTFLSVSPP